MILYLSSSIMREWDEYDDRLLVSIIDSSFKETGI